MTYRMGTARVIGRMARIRSLITIDMSCQWVEGVVEWVGS